MTADEFERELFGLIERARISVDHRDLMAIMERTTCTLAVDLDLGDWPTMADDGYLQ